MVGERIDMEKKGKKNNVHQRDEDEKRQFNMTEEERRQHDPAETEECFC